MSDDTIYAAKLAIFTILIVVGVVGFIVRMRELRKPHVHAFKPNPETQGRTSVCVCGAEVTTAHALELEKKQ